MLYKFIDESTVKSAEGPVRIGNAIISNPTDEHYRAVGYKPISADELPEYDETTHMVIPIYADGDVIAQSWTVVELPPVEPEQIQPTPPSTEKRLEAVEMALLAMMEAM